MTTPPLRLAAVLVVRDEQHHLPGALTSLAGVVDEVHVLDTGSVDATVTLAREAGAVVRTAVWTDDFAAARNAAMAGVDADWVLSLDADERVAGDPVALRALLAGATADAVLVEIDNSHDELPWTHRAVRLFRPEALTWHGRVHEQLVRRSDAAAPASAAVPREVLRLDHLGYASADVRQAKSVRNAALGQTALDALLEAGATAPALARTLLDLGRSFVGAGRAQDAVDTFEALRDLCPGTPEWVQGTDALARLLLGAGLDAAALVLVEDLRGAGAPRAYCDWLAAQALAQLGELTQAADLLAGVDRVVDTAGRVYAPAALRELKALVGSLQPAAAGA